jgi:hypothetical protein
MANWLNYLRLLWPARRAEWSIGIYEGTSPLELGACAALGGTPALTRKSLGAIEATGVADPFMIAHEGEWLMFFEIENRSSGKGEIGLARSADAIHWRFEAIVLKEPFHLSYPHVFEHEGAHYMVPESCAAGAVRLYRSPRFPFEWALHAQLLEGDIADATPFFHEGRWWIIAIEGFQSRNGMVIFHADRIEGPWRAHARNPITIGDRRRSRPAGRMIRHANQLVRLAQDFEQHYGQMVRAYVVEELTPDSYRERPAQRDEKPILCASGKGWNSSGMHHLDAHQQDDGHWIACVDGRRTRWYWPVLDRVSARIRGRGAST